MVIFGKQRRRRPAQEDEAGPRGGTIRGQCDHFVIEYDMMKKGADVRRKRKTVRQFAVLVGSEVRLVTSGDTVDRETYEALQAAGVLAPGASEGAGFAAAAEAAEE